jgi:hypothetical protein
VAEPCAPEERRISTDRLADEAQCLKRAALARECCGQATRNFAAEPRPAENTSPPAFEKEALMTTRPNRSAELKFVVTNTLIVRDIQRSVAFYRDVLAATVLREGEPTFLRLANIWLTINRGGGPTDDKPEVVATRRAIPAF